MPDHGAAVPWAAGLLVAVVLHPILSHGAAAAEPARTEQIAQAVSGGIAVNIEGDWNTVTIAATDPETRGIVRQLVAETRSLRTLQLRHQAEARAQRRQLASLRVAATRLDDLESAVQWLVDASRRTPSPDRIDMALHALKEGDVAPSAALLAAAEKQAVTMPAPAGVHAQALARPDAGPQAAARLAREQGALTALADPAAALSHYERAAAYEPDDVDTLISIGELQFALGNLLLAGQSLDRATQLARARMASEPDNWASRRHLVMLSLRVGAVQAAMGEREAALATYREGLSLAETAGPGPSSGTRPARDIATLHYRIGDVTVERGDYAQALAHYGRALQINEALDDQRRNTAWIHQKLGMALELQGQSDAALQQYREAARIREDLLRAEPGHPYLLRELALAYTKAGDALYLRGDRSEALKDHRRAEAIVTPLVVRPSVPAAWLRDLAWIYQNIGDVLSSQRHWQDTVRYYQQALDIREALHRQDESNADWLRDLVISQRRLGGALAASGEGKQALVLLRQSVASAQALVQRDENNVRWRAELGFSYWRLGDVGTALPSEERRLLVGKAVALLEPLEQRNQLAPLQRRMLPRVRRTWQQLQ